MPTKSFYKHRPLQTKASSPKAFKHPVDVNKHRRVVGDLPNYTNSNTQPFHSLNEHDWLLILDVEVNEFHATAFHAQPETFPFRRNGIAYRYTPDIRTTFQQGWTVFQEVKPDEHAASQEFEERWEYCTEVLADAGHELELILVSDIRREPRYTNVMTLQRARHIMLVPEITLPIDDVLGDGGQLPIGRISAAFQNRIFARQVIWALILRKHLTIDLNEPLSEDSLVRKV